MQVHLTTLLPHPHPRQGLQIHSWHQPRRLESFWGGWYGNLFTINPNQREKAPPWVAEHTGLGSLVCKSCFLGELKSAPPPAPSSNSSHLLKCLTRASSFHMTVLQMLDTILSHYIKVICLSLSSPRAREPLVVRTWVLPIFQPPAPSTNPRRPA